MMQENNLWTAVVSTVSGAVAAFTTWKVGEVSLRSSLREQACRLSIVERQTQATTLLALEIALALGLNGPALDAARRALVVPESP